MVVCAIALAEPAAAQAVTTQTFATSESEFDPGVRNQGWWSPTSPTSTLNDNYLAGQPVDGGGSRFRNFFSFDLVFRCARRAASPSS